ncbi:MAG: M23 family metallopeptidase [Deltaproteobacteria bacterium]|nr:M23 family metallopeptidase [Deltaproteobacteria bacterium]
MSAALTLAAALVATATAAPSVRLVPAEPRLGDLVVVYVQGLGPEVKAGALVAFGHTTALGRTSQRSLRGFVPVPLDIAPGQASLQVRAGGAVVDHAFIVQGRAFETSELRVSRRYTDAPKSKALKARLRRESKTMERLWARAPSAPLDLGAPAAPTPGEVTSPFGVQRVFNGEVQSVHYGLDLDGRTGAPVFAALPGRVALSQARFYSGQTLALDHGGGLFTLYFHLSRRRVRPGARVKAGARIGDVGRTGRVTGPHLHFAAAVRVQTESGKTRSMYVDPEGLLARPLTADPPP